MQQHSIRWIPALGLIGILALVAFIALPGLNAPFILDDLDQLHQTASQSSLSDAFQRDCYGLYRPVKTIAFFILETLFPDSPLHWHLVGLSLYCISIVLFYLLSKRLFHSPWMAFLSTSIWATAPTQVSTYVWSSSINIQFMTIALLSAMLLFDALQSKPCSSKKTALSIVGIIGAYAFAFFSYESAIVLPALLLIWSLLRGQNILHRKSIGTMMACGIAGLALLLIRHVMKGNMGIENSFIHGFSPIQLSWASGSIIWHHFSLWWWPFDRQSITGTLVNTRSTAQSMQFLTAWLLILACACAGWIFRKRFPHIALGFLFFVFAFFPMSNVIPLFNGPFADYYLIIPSIGLTFALMGMLTPLATELKNSTEPVIRIAVLALCVTILGTRLLAAANAVSWSQSWKNEQILFTRTLEAMPDAYTAKSSLARCLLKEGDLKAAEQLAHDSVHAAPWFRQARYALIDIYLKSNKMDAALAETEAVLQTNPRQVYPWNVMGFIAENHLGDQTRAIEAYGMVQQLSWQAESEKTTINLARLLSINGRDAEAIAALEKAMVKAPGAKIIKQIHAELIRNPDLFRNAAL